MTLFRTVKYVESTRILVPKIIKKKKKIIAQINVKIKFRVTINIHINPWNRFILLNLFC